VRICHLGKYYPPAPGGIETHVQMLARAQADAGCSVQVVCVNHADSNGRDLTWSRRGISLTTSDIDRGVHVIRLGRSFHAAKIDIVPEITQLFRRLRRERVDLLHLHTPNPTMLLAVAALRPRIPLVITHHSDVVKQRLLYPVFQPFERLVYDRADSVISNSPGYIGGSPLLTGLAEKVTTIPMGLYLQPFIQPSDDALRFAAHLRQEHGAPLWLAIGRCVYYKGFHIALRALRDVPGRLLLVGQGPMKDYLLRLSRELGVADRVVWFAHLQPHEIVGAYHAATAFWFPSNARSEAFGLVQVEAMASGCPVINTSIPHSGVPWVSEHERTGLTVPINDSAAFAAAARRFVHSPALRNALATEAVQQATSRFGDVRMATETLAVYRDVLNARAVPVSPEEFEPRTPPPVRTTPDVRSALRPFRSHDGVTQGELVRA
jgi:glycosyltransferase involved in cell wall biosynthesis